MATKLTATTPRGTFSRKTDRPYTFVAVTAGLTEAKWAADRKTGIVNYGKMAAHDRSKADRIDATGAVEPRDEIMLRTFDGTPKRTPADYAAMLRGYADSYDESSAKLQSATYTPDRKGWATWHSTRQLAMKELDKRIAFGYEPVGVFAVDAEVK